jgi:hypothetical protein
MGTDWLEHPAFLVGIFLGIVIGWVSLWSFQNPAVGRLLARAFAVLALGFGVVWLVTAIVDLLRDVPEMRYHSPLGSGGIGAAFGWGAGGLAAGITALVLSFLGSAKKPVAGKENTLPPS